MTEKMPVAAAHVRAAYPLVIGEGTAERLKIQIASANSLATSLLGL